MPGTYAEMKAAFHDMGIRKMVSPTVFSFKTRSSKITSPDGIVQF